jgi:hypothetical protein
LFTEQDTPQVERNWGGGDKEETRERVRNSKIYREIWRESRDPVENVLNPLSLEVRCLD